MKRLTFFLVLCLVLSFITACAPSTVANNVERLAETHYPDLPAYPSDSGIPPIGVYQAPADTSGVTWVPFPEYADNSKLVPGVSENIANCAADPSGWIACAYAFYYQVSLISPGNAVGVNITPSITDGYMLVETAVTGWTGVQTNESRMLAVSDGTTVFLIRMTGHWPIEDMKLSLDAYTYEIGVMPVK